MSGPRRASGGLLSLRPTQEGVVFGVTVLLFVVFSLLLPKFLTAGNILTLLNNVSTLGMLAIGMGVVVVGRGIDLTMVAVMVIGVCFAIWLSTTGVPFAWAIVIGGALVVAIGVVTGAVIAVAEIQPIFATLALASVIYGAGRIAFKSDVVYAPSGLAWFQFIGSGTVLGVPVSIYATAIVAAASAAFLKFTRFGRFVYAVGDNPAAARTFGLPTRPVVIAQYTTSALIAYLAGILICALVSGINTRIYNSNLIYDVLLVVVLGGIGLSGGKGGVRNVVVGTILVGVLIDGMTILNVNYTAQNLIKGLILLAALGIDAVVNPRDEQTSQSGDI